ncbi:MAG: hypothetical protein A2W90_14955 [Bacteroidetes bacterium GWF2_42_66]|nr:MAG: hypothetical protein A2W92_11120 [Bacteroidetes bacterium GWA2_42_15]OFX98989.1 MAG: hypothetical protein A2W89_06540 [Bacteroidetes bacterium GWE2_42_39]OFY46058.1 MAG: hypothetical protein A2W90_14955 [Bacteroidetes bacterium GWF2_42_66]HBL77226.1 hypothetical protein [Prolixibacteraceae bacterium]HCR90073.1 hypothetical protein [Prolixibacteraceae bacterium]
MRAVKMFRFIFLFLIIAIGLNSLSSCNRKNNQKQSSNDIHKTFKKEFEEYVSPLPSAFEVTSMLNEIEAGYIGGITNDPEKAGTYFTERSKAVNLGIYAADLAYTITYNKKTEVQDYFAACEILVRELDFAPAFGHDLSNRIEASIDNKDQLVEIISEMFENVYSYLNKQGRSELSYLILTGTVIEGLYLTTHISGNTFQNPEIIKAILFQKDPLQDLETLMKESKNEEMTKDARQIIQEINSIYATEEGNTSMTEQQVMRLTETLEKIRNSYIQ